MDRTTKQGPERPAGAPLTMLSTGVPGFDQVSGGGIPALSFNLVAGGPGSGKTTIAMQLLFANATPERPGLFITLLGETSLKMLRYQQRFEFFDAARIGVDVHFVNLSEEALNGNLEAVLARIAADVDRLNPGVVVVDSFRSLVRSAGTELPDGQLERFVQRLALHLTTWEVTSFLIGEYQEQELRNPIFTVADGIFWMTQAVDRNSVVRKLQVVKTRGVQQMPGLHTMRITRAGVTVFPRIPERTRAVAARGNHRLSTGIVGLDALMHGGIPAGDSLVLAGPTGSGKSTFAMQFVADGLRNGESAVIAIFEEHPDVYLERAKSVGVDLIAAIAADKLALVYLRPLDLSVDETLEEIRSAVARTGATRVVIDSISGFEMALAPTFRIDFRESLYRLIGALTSTGVTIFSTVEVVLQPGFQLTGYNVSFLTDDIISQRYVEVEGALRAALVVVKMRGSPHSREFWTYDITPTGVQLREALRDYDGITSGIPTRQLRGPVVRNAGLTEGEGALLDAILSAGGLSIEEAERLPPEQGPALVVAIERLEQLGYVRRTGDHLEPVPRPRGP